MTLDGLQSIGDTAPVGGLQWQAERVDLNLSGLMTYTTPRDVTFPESLFDAA
jgi:hypothetical protein